MPIVEQSRVLGQQEAALLVSRRSAFCCLAGSDGDLVDKGKFLAVRKKIDGDWVVAALSFTSDAPAPTPIGD